MAEAQEATRSGRHGPLHGVRVLDLTSVVMGPLATQVLGDLGADVITVESAAGDIGRGMGRRAGRQLSDISLNLLRNKRNVSIDLKHPDGLAAVLRIAATCDVFVTNLRPKALRGLGLDHPAVAVVRPDIVYCQAQGWSSESGRADEPAFDDVIQAAAGVADVMERASGIAMLMPTLLADKVSGLLLSNSVLAALYHRAVTGEGQRVEVPMVDALRWFLLVEHLSGRTVPGTEGEGRYQRIFTPNRGPLAASDGPVSIFPYLPAHWQALLVEAGLDELADDPRLAGVGGHKDPAFEYETLRRIAPCHTAAEWLAFCSAHGIPAAEVPGIDELAEALPMTEHPEVGPHRSVPPPVRFGATPASVRSPAPLIGQHNAEVLAEVGLSATEIDDLVLRGVIRDAPVTRRGG